MNALLDQMDVLATSNTMALAQAGWIGRKEADLPAANIEAALDLDGSIAELTTRIAEQCDRPNAEIQRRLDDRPQRLAAWNAHMNRHAANRSRWRQTDQFDANKRKGMPDNWGVPYERWSDAEKEAAWQGEAREAQANAATSDEKGAAFNILFSPRPDNWRSAANESARYAIAHADEEARAVAASLAAEAELTVAPDPAHIDAGLSFTQPLNRKIAPRSSKIVDMSTPPFRSRLFR